MKRKKRAFVLMPFRNPYDSYYPAIFKPALEEAGYEVTRADDLFSPTPIIMDIQESILNADLILCEMTGRNPNVFYELGLAHAVGKPAILLSQNSADIPFDVNHIRCIIYETSMAGWETQLRANIKKAALALVDKSNRMWPPPLASRREFVEGLGNEQRTDTRRSLDLLEIRDKVSSFDESLYQHLRSVNQRCLTSVIMSGFVGQVSNTPIPNQPEFLRRSVVINYRLSAEHFPGGRAKIDFVYGFTVAHPDCDSPDLSKALFRFEGRIGNEKLQRSDLVEEPYTFATYPMLLYSIKRPLTIDGTIDVRLEMQNLSWVSDATDITYVRYPCKGFTCALSFLPGYFYDHAWFAQWEQMKTQLPRLEDVQVSETGITVSTHDWLLPGEGVAMTWYPPHPKAPTKLE